MFFEICKFKYRGLFFQELTLGHLLRYQLTIFAIFFVFIDARFSLFTDSTFWDKRVVKCIPFLAILMLNYVRKWAKLMPLKSPKIGSWEKTFLSLDLRISKNILQIGEIYVYACPF